MDEDDVVNALVVMRWHQLKKQKEIADAMGISRSHLSEIENKKKALSMENFFKYCVALKMKPEKIIAYARRRYE
mgnify:CR=1 FL=1